MFYSIFNRDAGDSDECYIQSAPEPISPNVGTIDIIFLYDAYRGDMEYLEFRPNHSQDIA